MSFSIKKHTKGNPPKREFTLHWGSIEFSHHDKSYTANLNTEDTFYFYELRLNINEEVFDELSKITNETLKKNGKTKKSYLRVIKDSRGIYQLTSKFSLRISKETYVKSFNTDGCCFKFSAKYKGVSNQNETYEDVLKRMKKRDENRKGYSNTPIKVVLGGSASSK